VLSWQDGEWLLTHDDLYSKIKDWGQVMREKGEVRRERVRKGRMAGYFDTESSKEGRKERERERRLDDVDQSLLPNRAATPDFQFAWQPISENASS
jgi:hypothetical protein